MFSVAGTNQRLAVELNSCIAPMHPDWQLCLDAVYAAVAQPRFPGYELFDKTQDMREFGTLVQQLVPNISAQLTAAAILCRLHHSRMGDKSQGSSMYRHFNAAVAAGDFDGVMALLITALVVRPHTDSTVCDL